VNKSTSNRAGVLSSVLFLLSLTWVQSAAALCVVGDDIGGSVYHDSNSSGTRSLTEVGQEGITVNAYEDANPVPIASVITAVDGSYNFASLLAGRTGTDRNIRLEFVNLPSHLSPASEGTNSGTATQIVSDTDCNVDFGLMNRRFRAHE